MYTTAYICSEMIEGTIPLQVLGMSSSISFQTMSYIVPDVANSSSIYSLSYSTTASSVASTISGSSIVQDMTEYLSYGHVPPSITPGDTVVVTITNNGTKSGYFAVEAGYPAAQV